MCWIRVGGRCVRVGGGGGGQGVIQKKNWEHRFSAKQKPNIQKACKSNLGSGISSKLAT